MNFSDLLDEDGQGTRELDAWLAENIAGEDVEWDDYWECYKTGDVIVTEAHPVYVKPFTTGDSIDPIWELAKEYLKEPSIKSDVFKGSWICREQSDIPNATKQDKQDIIGRQDNEQLAIAQALFKAYQNENN